MTVLAIHFYTKIKSYWVKTPSKRQNLVEKTNVKPREDRTALDNPFVFEKPAPAPSPAP